MLTLFSAFFLPLTFIVGRVRDELRLHARAAAALGLPGRARLMAAGDRGDLRLVPPPRMGAGMSFLWLLLGLAAGAARGWWLAGDGLRRGGGPGRRRPICCPIRRSSGCGAATRRSASGSRRWTRPKARPTRSGSSTPTDCRWRRSWRWTAGSSGRAIRSRAEWSGWRAAPSSSGRAAASAVALLLPAGARAQPTRRGGDRSPAPARRRTPPAAYGPARAGANAGGVARIGLERRSPPRVPARAAARRAGRCRRVRERAGGGRLLGSG